MFTIISNSAPESWQESKRTRGTYSRYICLGCRERRIRCELPADARITTSGEPQEVQTPCYRCRRLGLRCVVRRTILGRPSAQGRAITRGSLQRETLNDIKQTNCEDTPLPANSATVELETSLVHRPVLSQTRLAVPKDVPPNSEARHWEDAALVLHSPQSPETLFIVRAIDTLRYEHVEDEWFRHLPAHYGHTPALDLAVKALVQACAYARGIAPMTSTDCFQALSPVLSAVKANLMRSHRQPNDNMLAATALLAPFEGTVKRDGVPSRPHIDGLAAIIAARPATQPVSELARDILDWYAAESSIMACIQGTYSPFEKIPRTYFASDGLCGWKNDPARLKALGNELFTRIPRLVMLVRTLRLQPSPQHASILRAHRLLQRLLELQDPEVERRLVQNITVQSSNDSGCTRLKAQSLHFSSVKEYEALTCYWQSRLSLLRLEQRLHGLLVSQATRKENTSAQILSLPPSFGPQTNETHLLAKTLLMATEYAPALPLFRQQHLLAHAMIVVWGATMDAGVYQETNTVRTDSLSDLLLKRVNHALDVKPPFLAKDMDVAADLFVGGERAGRLVELYGL